MTLQIFGSGLTQRRQFYLKKIPGEEDRISPLQAVPIVAILGMLALAAIVDRKYCRI